MTSTRDGDVVERLRSLASLHKSDGLPEDGAIMEGAAAEIVHLRADNERLREALKECVEWFDEPAGCDSPIPNEEMKMLVKARAALTNTGGDDNG